MAASEKLWNYDELYFSYFLLFLNEAEFSKV